MGSSNWTTQRGRHRVTEHKVDVRQWRVKCACGWESRTLLTQPAARRVGWMHTVQGASADDRAAGQ